MIQDIEPRIFYNNFMNKKVEPQDLFLSYEEDSVLVREDAQFLFAIDDINYYLIDEKGLDSEEGWVYVSISRFRTESKYWRSFAGAVGRQLNCWYDDDRLLLTKYRGRAYTNYALIAGFSEIGESLEETVHREVKEEVGLNVRNLQFYKSQPWPFTDTLLAGFYAELDGDDSITLQEDELSLGVWMNREDLPPDKEKISLTSEMMETFRIGAFKNPID